MSWSNASDYSRPSGSDGGGSYSTYSDYKIDDAASSMVQKIIDSGAVSGEYKYEYPVTDYSSKQYIGATATETVQLTKSVTSDSDISSRMDEADKRFVKETMLEGVSNLLPEIVEEITPIILQKTAKLVKSNVNKYGNIPVSGNTKKQKGNAGKDAQAGTNSKKPSTKKREENSKWQVDPQKEGLLLLEQNRHIWKSLLDKRKDLYYRLVRAAAFLVLYKECLEEAPIYVPKKFRKDDRNDKSQCVLDIIYKMDVERFKNEISLLEVQIDDWKKEIRTIDVDILNKISSIDTSEEVILAMESHMNKKVEKEAEKIDKERAAKMASKREEFRKDKVKCKERYRSLFYPNARQYFNEDIKNASSVSENRPRKKNKSSKERKLRSRTLPLTNLPTGPILSYNEVLNPGSSNLPDRSNGRFEEIPDARKVFLRSGYQPSVTEGDTTEVETNFPPEEEDEGETTDKETLTCNAEQDDTTTDADTVVQAPGYKNGLPTPSGFSGNRPHRTDTTTEMETTCTEDDTTTEQETTTMGEEEDDDDEEETETEITTSVADDADTTDRETNVTKRLKKLNMYNNVSKNINKWYTDDNLRQTYISRSGDATLSRDEMRKTYFTRSSTFTADTKVETDSKKLEGRSNYSNIVDTIADIEEYMVKKRMMKQKSEIRYQIDDEILKLGTRSCRPRVEQKDYFLRHEDMHAARKDKVEKEVKCKEEKVTDIIDEYRQKYAEKIRQPYMYQDHLDALQVKQALGQGNGALGGGAAGGGGGGDGDGDGGGADGGAGKVDGGMASGITWNPDFGSLTIRDVHRLSFSRNIPDTEVRFPPQIPETLQEHLEGAGGKNEDSTAPQTTPASGGDGEDGSSKGDSKSDNKSNGEGGIKESDGNHGNGVCGGCGGSGIESGGVGAGATGSAASGGGDTKHIPPKDKKENGTGDTKNTPVKDPMKVLEEELVQAKNLGGKPFTTSQFNWHPRLDDGKNSLIPTAPANLLGRFGGNVNNNNGIPMNDNGNDRTSFMRDEANANLYDRMDLNGLSNYLNNNTNLNLNGVSKNRKNGDNSNKKDNNNSNNNNNNDFNNKTNNNGNSDSNSNSSGSMNNKNSKRSSDSNDKGKSKNRQRGSNNDLTNNQIDLNKLSSNLNERMKEYERLNMADLAANLSERMNRINGSNLSGRPSSAPTGGKEPQKDRGSSKRS